MATHLYETTDLAGVQFLSQHGDEFPLWAIFERPGDPAVSPLLADPITIALTDTDPHLMEAFQLLDLRWSC